MTVLNEQESNWVSELARKLRLLQADLLNVTAEQRRELLAEELGRNFKPIPKANWNRFLEALRARFPINGQIPEAGSKGPPPSAPPAPPVAAPETFENLIERFVHETSTLTEGKRREVRERLFQAGLGMDSKELVLEVSDQLRQKLGLQGEQQPRLTSLVELSASLLEAICVLDKNAMLTMKDLAPKSQVLNHSDDFRQTTARFLMGEGDLLDRHLQIITRLLGAVFAALLAGGKDFAKQFLERFSPEAIERVVRDEGGVGVLGKLKKGQCWDRYKELAENATPEVINHQIKTVLAAYIEKTLRGGR